jgi:acetyltransferase-like isoleucine patch superfamily enzyme
MGHTLVKHIFIDYSGHITIEDNVKMGANVMIEIHHRDLEANKLGKDINIPTNLLIGEGAYIGIKSTILDGCNYIGKNVRVGV